MENALIRPGNQGEGGRSGPLIENWRDAQLVRRALREGWGLTAEVRRIVVEQMLHEVQHNPEARARIAAARVLVAADAVDVRREALAGPEPSSKGDEASTIFHQIGATPEGRALLSKMTDLIFNPPQPTEALAGPEATDGQVPEAPQTGPMAPDAPRRRI